MANESTNLPLAITIFPTDREARDGFDMSKTMYEPEVVSPIPCLFGSNTVSCVLLACFKSCFSDNQVSFEHRLLRTLGLLQELFLG